MSRQPQYGSDIVVDLLRDANIEYVAFNPGATFRGIHDSLVNYDAGAAPEIIFCCHEEISVAIAHGYAKATGKPMAAIVHNIVGLQHASMAIYNAWCDRVPMLVLGATGPMDLTKRRPRIDWIHTALVQGNQVRDYVKWDDQPHNLFSLPESFWRAMRLTCSQPTAPVYVCIDASIQEQELSPSDLLELPVPDASRLRPPEPPNASAATIEWIAKQLIEAEWPVLMADRCGRAPETFDILSKLAELLASPVIDRGGRLNFPSRHPMDMTGDESECLYKADFILALDVADLYGALRTVDKQTRGTKDLHRPGCPIVSVTLDEYLVRSWSADVQRLQPVDRTVAADTAVFLPELLACCRRLLAENTMRSELLERIERRRARVTDRHDQLRQQWLAQARAAAEAGDDSAADRDGILPEALALCLGELLEGEDWSLVNGKLNHWPRKLWNFDRPYRYLGESGGGGVGYGSGASIGAALAFRGTGRICVNIQSDGDLLYTPSSLWTAAHHRIPLLFVMNNNRSYFNSEDHAFQVARIRKRPQDNKAIATQLVDPEVDFVGLARSLGIAAYGPVRRYDQLRPILAEALEKVKQGEPVLVDVHTRVSWK